MEKTVTVFVLGRKALRKINHCSSPLQGTWQRLLNQISVSVLFDSIFSHSVEEGRPGDTEHLSRLNLITLLYF
jgi:hypothetical protein